MRRAKQLVAAHGKRWLPKSLPLTKVRWDRGFPVAARLRDLAARDPAIATLREIDVEGARGRGLPAFEAAWFAGVESWLGVRLVDDPPGPLPGSRVRRLGIASEYGRLDGDNVARHAAMFPALEELVIQRHEHSGSADGDLAWCRALPARLPASCVSLRRLAIWGVIHYEKRAGGWEMVSIAIPYALGLGLLRSPTAESACWLELAHEFRGPIAVNDLQVDELAPVLGRRVDELATFADFEVVRPLS